MRYSQLCQLKGDAGYSFYFMLIQCLKVIYQPKVIQLMSGPGYSFYSYAYSIAQGNSAAKSYPANE